MGGLLDVDLVGDEDPLADILLHWVLLVADENGPLAGKDVGKTLLVHLDVLMLVLQSKFCTRSKKITQSNPRLIA